MTLIHARSFHTGDYITTFPIMQSAIAQAAEEVARVEAAAHSNRKSRKEQQHQFPKPTAVGERQQSDGNSGLGASSMAARSLGHTNPLHTAKTKFN